MQIGRPTRWRRAWASSRWLGWLDAILAMLFDDLGERAIRIDEVEEGDGRRKSRNLYKFSASVLRDERSPYDTFQWHSFHHDQAPRIKTWILSEFGATIGEISVLSIYMGDLHLFHAFGWTMSLLSKWPPGIICKLGQCSTCLKLHDFVTIQYSVGLQ